MSGTAVDVRELERATERKARRMFWISLLLSVLITAHAAYQAKGTGHWLSVANSFLPAVLIWSLVATAYAFHTLRLLAQRRAGRESDPNLDPRTGVFTLGYLTSVLAQERRKALKTCVPSTVAYIAMTDLDKVDSTFGQAVRDIVLKTAAHLIEDHVRRCDVVGRVDDDTFLVIMPETNGQEAQSVTTLFQEAIAAFAIDMGKRGRIDFVGCRTALAVFPGEGQTVEEIVAAARQKLP